MGPTHQARRLLTTARAPFTRRLMHALKRSSISAAPRRVCSSRLGAASWTCSNSLRLRYSRLLSLREHNVGGLDCGSGVDAERGEGVIGDAPAEQLRGGCVVFAAHLC